MLKKGLSLQNRLNMKHLFSILLFTVVFFLPEVNAQTTRPATTATVKTDTTKQRKFIQFSGIIVTADSLRPIPFVNIFDKKTGRGTVSDYYGFYSFVAMEGDTIIFSSVGFKRSRFVIPDTLTEDKYSLIQMMQPDTIVLPQVTVYPWPSKEQFAQAFVNMNLQDDYMARAYKNMQDAQVRDAAIAMSNDAQMAYYQAMRMERYKLYYAGQVPPNNLLNPIAWYQFVQAWKNGDFKQK